MHATRSHVRCRYSNTYLTYTENIGERERQRSSGNQHVVSSIENGNRYTSDDSYTKYPKQMVRRSGEAVTFRKNLTFRGVSTGNPDKVQIISKAGERAQSRTQN